MDNSSSTNGNGPLVEPGIIIQGQPASEEAIRLLKQQQVLLLHAHRCQQRDRDAEAAGAEDSEEQNVTHNCTLRHCQVMKGVLSHMVDCRDGRNCTFRHCSSSRRIISHWKHCTRNQCEICLPLRVGTSQVNRAEPIPPATDEVEE